MMDIETADTDHLMMTNSGRLCEQFAGQHLLYLEEHYKTPELYDWVREAKSSSAELDYLISSGSKIIPVEIKAGKTGRLKSLHQFIREKEVNTAVRINLSKPSVFKDSKKLPDGQGIDYHLISIPFYLIGQIRRLVQNG